MNLIEKRKTIVVELLYADWLEMMEHIYVEAVCSGQVLWEKMKKICYQVEETE